MPWWERAYSFGNRGGWPLAGRGGLGREASVGTEIGTAARAVSDQEYRGGGTRIRLRQGARAKFRARCPDGTLDPSGPGGRGTIFPGKLAMRPVMRVEDGPVNMRRSPRHCFRLSMIWVKQSPVEVPQSMPG